jgi:hypothetical protein
MNSLFFLETKKINRPLTKPQRKILSFCLVIQLTPGSASEELKTGGRTTTFLDELILVDTVGEDAQHR